MAGKVHNLAQDTVSSTWRFKNLYIAGILGPIVFVLNVIFGGAITPGYSHIKNAVSELTQAGSPNIAILSLLFVVSGILIFILGIAIMIQYWHRNRRVCIGGGLIMVNAIFAVLLATVFPQDPIGAEMTFPGTMHLILVGISALLIVGGILSVGFGLDNQGIRWHLFKRYSVISVVVMLAGGMTTPILIVNHIEVLGLAERITQLAYLQWFFVFSIKSYMDSVH